MMMKKTRSKIRDPNWRWLRALGHKTVKDKTVYVRKIKHKDNSYVSDTKETIQKVLCNRRT